MNRTGIPKNTVSAFCAVAVAVAALCMGCGEKPPRQDAAPGPGQSKTPAVAKETAKRSDPGPDPRRLVGQ